MRYTAKLHKNNLRDVHLTTVKVLFTDIKDEDGNEFRDHCWVTINNELRRMMNRLNDKESTVIVRFIAKEKEYKTYGPAKKTLYGVKSIEVLEVISKKNRKF